MSTDSTNIAKDLFIGYTPENTRVYLQINVRHYAADNKQTVNHEPIRQYDELSVMGAEYAGKSGKADRQNISGGQIIHTARSVLDGGKLARGVERADLALILDAWERWHLNAMNAACAHQARDAGLDSEPCEDTGYKWGSAWLVEPMPAGLIEQVTAAVARMQVEGPSKPSTRVKQDALNGNRWVAQYFDKSMSLWFDIGDAKDTEAEARDNERAYLAR